MTRTTSQTKSCYRLIGFMIAWAIYVTAALFNGSLIVACESPATTNSTSATKAVPREKIIAISQRIDELVDKKLATIGQSRNETTADEIFLRRAYLDIVGRIPTLAETQGFLESRSATKRQDLIDGLLDSYGYVSRQFNFWADLLRINSRMNGGLSGQSYIDFVKDALEQNVPYDEMVHQLIASEGSNLQRGNGAVGYYLRDINMPEDNMSNTIRIFLGTRLECAQCHDHPFDQWTQRQYFEMVAFTGGLQYRSRDGLDKLKQLRSSQQDLPENQRKVFQNIFQMTSYGVFGSGTGLARLPEEYKGDDGYGGEIVVAKEMFDSEELTSAEVPPPPKKNKNNRKPNNKAQQANIPGARVIDSRAAYADWLTSPDNPRFATVIANRLWKQAMGVGLIEPLDVIEDNTVASNPELMEYLTETMIELDFDLKQFLRAIYLSETYQATAYSTDVGDPKTYYFNGPVVRRMSAEQIWDSLLVLSVPDVDERLILNDLRYGELGKDAYEAYEKLTRMDAAEISAVVKKIAAEGNPQKKNYRDNPEVIKLQAARKDLEQQLRQARKKRDVAKERELKIEQAQLMIEFRKSQGRGSDYVRASEMSSPAKPGHFLREFGQSDRDQIDNSNTEPAVTQVLSMMNGYVESKLARDNNSLLMQAVMATTNAKDCVDIIFLSMLNRSPTSTESRLWQSDFDSAMRVKDKSKIQEVYTDLIWTLANSNEFIFVK